MGRQVAGFMAFVGGLKCCAGMFTMPLEMADAITSEFVEGVQGAQDTYDTGMEEAADAVQAPGVQWQSVGAAIGVVGVLASAMGPEAGQHELFVDAANDAVVEWTDRKVLEQAEEGSPIPSPGKLPHQPLPSRHMQLGSRGDLALHGGASPGPGSLKQARSNLC